MAKLIATNIELKAHLSLIVTADTFTSSFSPDVDAAMRDWVTPVLGKPLLDALVAAYAALPGTAMPAALNNLLPYVQDVIAPLGYLRYMPKNVVSSSDGGLTEAVDGETGRAAVRQWSYLDLKKQLQADGMAALDALYTFLDTATAGTFPLWEASTAYTQFKDTFIQTTADFESQLSINNSRYTFCRLKPSMETAEQLYIKGTISPELCAALKTKLAARTALTTEETEFMRLLKKSIAHYTMYEAAMVLPIMQGNTIAIAPVVSGDLYDMEMGRTGQTDNMLTDLKRSCKHLGDMWLGQAMNYLNSVASGSVMAAYYTSATYTANVDSTQFQQNDTPGSGVAMFC